MPALPAGEVSMAKSKHNDAECRQWVLNDEGLYNEFRAQQRRLGKPMKAWRLG